jgi:glycosyltransferase involved in cell wall biosynthesis
VRLVQILPGSGSKFFCENCARDGSLARGLRERGHEVVLGSLYLPLTPEPPAQAPPPPVFYGAVNLYLHHRFPSLGRLPPWLERLFDADTLLRLAGGLSGTTDAAALEGLTLSMLQGEEGGQAAELERLVRWLAEVRPDVVHLSNCLLLGLARRVRRELGIPVACSLQDEDSWLDALGAPARARAWAILRERAADVDLFLPVSAWYARFMGERLGLPAERLTVVPIGIDPSGLPAAPSTPRPGPPVIGFLSHVCERMGAGILAEAFLRLASGGRFPGLRLWFTGGSTGGDAAFLRRLKRDFARHGLRDRVRFVGSFERGERIRFLSSLTVLSVPVREGEAFGTFILEALAAGVPVVQPRLGGFSELVGDTGGGLLYEPNTPEALAKALAGLLGDPRRALALGAAGREAVLARYTAERMAAALESAFGRLAPAAGRTP